MVSFCELFEQHPSFFSSFPLSELLQAQSDSSFFPSSPHCSFCSGCFLDLALFFVGLPLITLLLPLPSTLWKIDATIPFIHFSKTASESPASESPIMRLLLFFPPLLLSALPTFFETNGLAPNFPTRVANTSLAGLPTVEASYPELPIPKAPTFNCDLGSEDRSGSGATRQSEEISLSDCKSVSELGGRVPLVQVGSMKRRTGGGRLLLLVAGEPLVSSSLLTSSSHQSSSDTWISCTL
mmetsp:Transcript_19190/g.41558  ORF Transcript_19190/g.41558 Transcript_19190/m.41558 type:complete len:239 (-) Transcript_19190:477-1193(-)